MILVLLRIFVALGILVLLKIPDAPRDLGGSRGPGVFRNLVVLGIRVVLGFLVVLRIL